MSELMQTDNNEVTLISIANGIDDIYKSFAEAMGDMMARHKGKKMAGSLVHWFAGSHVKTEKDVICEKFITDMESHLELFDQAIEGMDRKDITEACTVIVNRCSQTVPANSNSTSDLMRRAMIRMAIKYLPDTSREELSAARERISKAYPKWNRLPVEKEFLKEIDRILG